MAGAEDRPSRCSNCGTSLAGTDSVDVTVRRDGEERSTVLCDECATVECGSCGTAVPIGTALSTREDIWDSFDRYECVKCGDFVRARDIVELRHENNAGYRKRVCAECLQDIPIPSYIRVIRDVT